jgi:hypothetical protein
MKFGELESRLEKLAARRKVGQPLSEADAKLLAEFEDIAADIAALLSPEQIEKKQPELANFLRGLHDPELRVGFTLIREIIAEKTIEEAMPILRVLRRAKKRRGRKPIVDIGAVTKIRRLIESGQSLSLAAAEIAKQDHIRGNSLTSTAKRLKRKAQDKIPGN